MEIIYARQNFDHLTYGQLRKSLFLAGPTPRHPDVISWRHEALQRLGGELNFEGVVFVPENFAESWDESYFEAQCDWEYNGLEAARCVAFWVPRDPVNLPGYTTNQEFGAYMRSGKIVLGYPPEATKVKYMQYWADRLQIPVAHTLGLTLEFGIDMLDNQI